MKNFGIWYKIGWSFLRFHYRLWHRIEAVDPENVPEEGGVILASNHISHLDPPGIGVTLSRPVRFVAKDELFHQFFLSWYLPSIGVIPIKRGGGGREMLVHAADAVSDGDIVLLFPEGTRSKSGEPKRFRTGMVILAAMTGAPIVPVRISGSYDCMPPGSSFPKPGKIQVAFGKPVRYSPCQLNMDNREQMLEEASRIREMVASLPGWLPTKVKSGSRKTEREPTT